MALLVGWLVLLSQDAEFEVPNNKVWRQNNSAWQPMLPDWVDGTIRSFDADSSLRKLEDVIVGE